MTTDPMAPLKFTHSDGALAEGRLISRPDLLSSGAAVGVALVLGLAVLSGCGKHPGGMPGYGPPEVGVVTLTVQPVDLRPSSPAAPCPIWSPTCGPRWAG